MVRNRYIEARGFVPGVPEGLPGLVVSENPGRMPSARIIAVGDTSFGGRVAKVQEPLRCSSFEEVKGALEQADLVFANFEGVFLDEPQKKDDFTGPTDRADTLVAAGIRVVNLANNHSVDQGQPGLKSTAQALGSRGAMVVGAGPDPRVAASVVRTDLGDLRIGWLAAGRTGHKPPRSGWIVNELSEDAILRSTREARDHLDLLIVSLHTGFMFVEYPHPATRKLAHRLAAAGASLILMHHPHVLQGVEVLENGTVICYSLGNFLFDWQAGNIPTEAEERPQREGAMFCFEVDRQGVISTTLVPTIVGDDLDVHWPEPERAVEILNRVRRLGEALMGTDWEREFFGQRAERNTLHGIRTLWYVLRSGRVRELFRLMSRLRLQHLALLWSWIGQQGKGGK